jgi:hypothetical protein
MNPHDDLEKCRTRGKNTETSLRELSRLEMPSPVEAAGLRNLPQQDHLRSSRRDLPKSDAVEPGVLLDGANRQDKLGQHYVEILERCLRSALDLNTAVGKPIMP